MLPCRQDRQQKRTPGQLPVQQPLYNRASCPFEPDQPANCHSAHAAAVSLQRIGTGSPWCCGMQRQLQCATAAVMQLGIKLSRSCHPHLKAASSRRAASAAAALRASCCWLLRCCASCCSWRLQDNTTTDCQQPLGVPHAQQTQTRLGRHLAQVGIVCPLPLAFRMRGLGKPASFWPS